MNLYEELCVQLGEEQVLKNELMSRHTTFRIGGPADYFIMPRSAEEIKAAIALCKEAEIPYYIIGNGSNLLVGDGGFRGAVIQIYRNMSQVWAEGDSIRAQAGALLSKIAAEALEHSLTGFEFASGIPGTLGGAVMMNAGAYGGEMKHVLSEAKVLSRDGEQFSLKADEMEMGYRTSIVAKRDYIVLEATLALKPGRSEEIRARMEELKEKRVSKQPLEYPSAGSTFKRPEGHFAGQLIENAGLRGFSVGGAQVSEKHCGFVINKGNATSKDVLSLMEQVQDRVEAMSGVRLEPEVRRMGEF